jgi:hypothetical protein
LAGSKYPKWIEMRLRAVLATLALWRLQWSVMRVIGVCALAGLLLRWPGLG